MLQESVDDPSTPTQATNTTNGAQSQNLTTGEPPRKKQKNREESLQVELLNMAKEHFKKPDTESHAIARYWTFKLDRMELNQRRLAEKFINDILFEGECGNLHRNSVKINSDNQTNTTWNYSSSPSGTPSPYHSAGPTSPYSQPPPSPLPPPSSTPINSSFIDPEHETAASFLSSFYSMP